MTIVILTNICILNVVVVVVDMNASIIWMGIPLLVFPLEAIITIKRVEVVSSIIVSYIFVVIILVEVPIIILAKIVVVGTNIVSLKIVILSL